MFLPLNNYLPKPRAGALVSGVLLTTLLTTLLTACATQETITDIKGSATALQEQVPAWHNVTAGDSIAHLNQLLTSEEINQWVTAALANNPTLQQTQLTLQMRLAERRQTLGQRLPTVTAEVGSTSTRAADTEHSRNTEYSAALGVSWELDVWQRLASLDNASSKRVTKQVFLLQAATDTLVADVLKSGLGVISQQQELKIAQQRTHSYRQQHQFLLDRYKRGLGNLEDVDTVVTSLASAEASEAAANESLLQGIRALATLTGKPATDTRLFDQRIEHSYPQIPLTLADLPAQTLGRRPDLQAAYTSIEAADYSRKAAYRNMLPSLNVSLSLSDSNNSLRQALLTDPVWTLLGQLTAPLFQGGQLRAAADIADLEVAQEFAAYRDTLLTAVSEVENALSQEKSLELQRQATAKALASAERSLQSYQQKYRQGLADILDLITVQQKVYDLQSRVNTLQYQQLLNRVELGLALGLGWQADDQPQSLATHSDAVTQLSPPNKSLFAISGNSPL